MKTRTTLLTASALAMAAGAAIADVSVTGDGRMGIKSNANDDLEFNSRVRIKLSASAELDNGLSAKASFRAADAVGAGSGKKGEVSLSGPFGTLAMGDVDSGAKAAVGQVDGVGYTGLADLNEIRYIGKDKLPRLQYALPKLGVVQAWASVGQMSVNVTDDDAAMANEVSFDTAAFGAKADLTIGAGSAWLGGGFESSTDDDMDGHLVLGAGVSAQGLSATLVAGARDDANQFGLSVGYSQGLYGATVFFSDSEEFGGNKAFGAGVSYDLGGSAALKAGIATKRMDGMDDERSADLGVTFSF